MKNIFLVLAMTAMSIGMYAQDKVRNVSIELLGAQNMIGINYDSRFISCQGNGMVLLSACASRNRRA